MLHRLTRLLDVRPALSSVDIRPRRVTGAGGAGRGPGRRQHEGEHGRADGGPDQPPIAMAVVDVARIVAQAAINDGSVTAQRMKQPSTRTPTHWYTHRRPVSDGLQTPSSGLVTTRNAQVDGGNAGPG